MKKLGFALFVAGTLAFCGLTAWSDDGGRGREKDSMSAEEMSAVGLLSAGAIGAGVYFVRRRSDR